MDLAVDEVLLDGSRSFARELSGVLLDPERQGLIEVSIFVVLVNIRRCAERRPMRGSGAVVAQADPVRVVVVLASAGIADENVVRGAVGNEPPYIWAQQEAGLVTAD